MTPAAQIDIPRANTINYADSRQVQGAMYLLVKLYEHAGGFASQPAPGSRLRELRLQMSTLVKNIAATLPSAPLPEIEPLLRCYDMPYRISHGTPPEPRFYLDNTVRAFRRWLDGEKTMTPNAMALQLSAQIARNPCGLDDKYTLYYFKTSGTWTRELMATGTLSSTPQAELYLILDDLLRSDLFAYLGSPTQQHAAKARWTARHLLPTPADLDINTLEAYLSFYNTAAAQSLIDINPADALSYTRRTLLAHPSLNPLYRQALQLQSL